MCDVSTITIFPSFKTLHKPIQNYCVSSGALKIRLCDGIRRARESLGEKPVKDTGRGSRSRWEEIQIRWRVTLVKGKTEERKIG